VDEIQDLKSPEDFMKLFGVLVLLFQAFFPKFAIAENLAEAASNTSMKEVSLAADKFSRESAPPWVTKIAIPTTMPASEPIVVQLADTQFLWAGNQKSYFVHRAIRVNGTSGLEDVGQQTIDFNPEYQTLSLNVLRVIRNGESLDKIEPAKVRFLERELDLERGMYDGICTAAILIDDLRVGDILEIAYTVTGSNPVFEGRVADYASWELTVPTQERRVSILYSRNIPLEYQFIGGLNRDVKVVPKSGEREGFRELIFERSALKAIHVEENDPAGFQPLAWLQFSQYGNWNNVATWAVTLFDLPPASSPEFSDLIVKLRNLPDANKQVAAALRFVQSEIRYTSVSIGANSHRPYAPDQVLRRRYGDCKDKSALLVAILKSLGINAQPVLVSMNTKSGFGDWLPAPTPFDHVIAHVELNGRNYWLDPTAMQEPTNIDTLGQLHGGSDVLVVTRESKQLTRIPETTESTFEERQAVRLHNLDGVADLEVKSILNGIAAERLRLTLARMSEDQVAKSYLDAVRFTYPGAHWIKSFEVNDDHEANRIVVTKNFLVDNFAEHEDGSWSLSHRARDILAFLEIPDIAERITPYAISYPLHSIYAQTINLPSDIKIEAQHEIGLVSNQYFKLKKTVNNRGTTANVEYDLITLAREVPPKDLVNYVSDIRKARSLLNTALVIPDK
jgi:transglutaminase-like putative cysteine protease